MNRTAARRRGATARAERKCLLLIKTTRRGILKKKRGGKDRSNGRSGRVIPRAGLYWYTVPRPRGKAAVRADNCACRVYRAWPLSNLSTRAEFGRQGQAGNGVCRNAEGKKGTVLRRLQVYLSPNQQGRLGGVAVPEILEPHLQSNGLHVDVARTAGIAR